MPEVQIAPGNTVGVAPPVIDWRRTFELAAALLGDPDRLEIASTNALAAAPPFQNVPHALSPLPVYLRATGAERIAGEITRYLDVLSTVLRSYTEHADVRQWFGLGHAADRLIGLGRWNPKVPWISRVDGYLDQQDNSLRVLENNSDAPAGTLFTPRVDDVVHRILTGFGIEAEPTCPGSFSKPDVFAQELIAAGESVGKAEHIAVLQLEGRASRESVEFVRALSGAGRSAFMADPRTLRVKNGRSFFDDRPVDLCWNKVNTVDWLPLTTEEPFVAMWESALRNTELVHVNSFAARYITENKRSLAFLHEPQFQSLFNAQERALVDRLVPWTGGVAASTCTKTGEELLDALMAAPNEWVVKEPYDIRGDGVTIGHAVPRRQWQDAVGRALQTGGVAQRHVEPLRYPVFNDARSITPMPISLDTFVLGGQVSGFGSKASLSPQVNVFRGGRKLSVRVSQPCR